MFQSECSYIATVAIFTDFFHDKYKNRSIFYAHAQAGDRSHSNGVSIAVGVARS